MAKAKAVAGVQCDTAAAVGVRVVLVSRMQEMCALRDHALNWSDPEGVHDMRVASRRLRSALRDFMPYVRKSCLKPSLREIKDIARALGQVRDQDVAIMALEKLKPKAPDEITASLAQLIATRKSILNKARSELRRTVRKSDLRQLESDFIAAVEAATSAPDNGTQTPKNVPGVINTDYGAIARTIILERLRELEKLSSSLFRPFKVERLHRMRIAAKRLRYALELFEHCWGESLNRFSVKAAGLQSSLGELHDSDVWIKSFGDQLTGAHKRLSKDQTEVSVWLLSHFLKVRTRHVRNALARWHDWEATGLSSELKESVQKEPGVVVEAPVAGGATGPEKLPGQEELSGQEELAGQEGVAKKEDLPGQEERAATPTAESAATNI